MYVRSTCGLFCVTLSVGPLSNRRLLTDVGPWLGLLGAAVELYATLLSLLYSMLLYVPHVTPAVVELALLSFIPLPAEGRLLPSQPSASSCWG